MSFFNFNSFFDCGVLLIKMIVLLYAINTCSKYNQTIVKYLKYFFMMYFTATAGQLIISCVVIGSQLSSYFSDINVYQSQWGVFLSDVIVVFRISAWVLLLRGLYKGREEKKIRNSFVA